tara:strand:+ start:8764 stop:9654 length:891 start_codon:yes stop_codon:yes gene_type:complete
LHLARIQDLYGRTGWASLDLQTGQAWWILGCFTEWAEKLTRCQARAPAVDEVPVQPGRYTLLAPAESGARVFGVGLNYRTHLERLGSTEPPHPLSYIKPESALVPHLGEILYPAVTQELDYEIELVAVLGRPLEDEASAVSCLLGYTIGNDVSARDAGRALGRLDLFTQKALDQTTPLGPWLTLRAEAGGDRQPELDMQLSVNGEVRQQDNTREMIFSLAEVLNYLDARVKLRAGDVVFTGSTHGVGLESGSFLQPGDRIEATIQGIGTLINQVGPRRQLASSRRRGRLGLPSDRG